MRSFSRRPATDDMSDAMSRDGHGDDLRRFECSSRYTHLAAHIQSFCRSPRVFTCRRPERETTDYDEGVWAGAIVILSS